MSMKICGLDSYAGMSRRANGGRLQGSRSSPIAAEPDLGMTNGDTRKCGGMSLHVACQELGQGASFPQNFEVAGRRLN